MVLGLEGLSPFLKTYLPLIVEAIVFILIGIFFEKITGAIHQLYSYIKFKTATERIVAENIRNTTIDLEKIVGESESITKSYKIVGVDELKNEFKYGIFYTPKSLSQLDAQRLVILQTPITTTFQNERMLLEPKLQKSFFDQLAYMLAYRKNAFNLISEINSKIIAEGREKEFEILGKIINSSELFQLFRLEARRKIRKFGIKAFSIGSIKEFSNFVTDLGRGKFRVITVWLANIEFYLSEVKKVIKSDFLGLYLLAIKRHIKILDLVKERILHSYKKLKISFEDEYDWTFSETNRKIKAKMVRFEKKKIK